VPPSRANRLAFSSVMSAAKPIRTSAVFSLTPVASAAWRSIRSSILSVVLMQINMYQSGIAGKPFFEEVALARVFHQYSFEAASALLAHTINLQFTELTPITSSANLAAISPGHIPVLSDDGGRNGMCGVITTGGAA